MWPHVCAKYWDSSPNYRGVSSIAINKNCLETILFYFLDEIHNISSNLHENHNIARVYCISRYSSYMGELHEYELEVLHCKIRQTQTIL